MLRSTENLYMFYVHCICGNLKNIIKAYSENCLMASVVIFFQVFSSFLFLYETALPDLHSGGHNFFTVNKRKGSRKKHLYDGS